MKITVSRSLLSDALRKVQGLAAGKNSLPILSNVKIEAHDQKAKFTTTDLDITVVLDITCNVIEEGTITLPAKLLCAAIDRAPEGDVKIDVDEKTCKATILAGSSIFRITGLPAEDFPTLPVCDGDEQEFSLPQDVLKALFRRVVFAMSEDDTRRTLKGVFVKFADGFLSCVATDGRRLSVAEYHPDVPYPFSMNFILPAKSVLELIKNLGTTGNVAFKRCASQITASLDNGVIIYSKLMDDAYPNYAQVIPKDNDKIVIVDRAALIASIERVGIFSEAYSMKFEFANNELKLRSSTETNNGEETVPVKYEGEAISTTFNHAYILDALKSMDDDEVTLAFLDGTHPVVISCSTPGLVVVMPLRIN